MEAARTVDEELASNYVAHTLIGDPIADELMEEIASLGHTETGRLIGIFMDGRDENARSSAPAILRDFFESCESQPPWLDRSAFTPGVRMFHRNSRLVLGAMVGGTLVEGFATNIAKSFFITGRLRDQGHSPPETEQPPHGRNLLSPVAWNVRATAGNCRSVSG